MKFSEDNIGIIYKGVTRDKNLFLFVLSDNKIVFDFQNESLQDSEPY